MENNLDLFKAVSLPVQTKIIIIEISSCQMAEIYFTKF